MLRVILMLTAVTWAGGDLDRQWKARGLQGLEKADSLLKILPKDPAKRKTSKIWYEFSVEMAFASFVNPELNGIVRKRTPTVLAYHFILSLGDNKGDDLLDIAFLYEPKTEEFLGIRVDRLPGPWCLRPEFHNDLPNIVSVNNVNDLTIPAILFNKKDPFDVLVLPM